MAVVDFESAWYALKGKLSEKRSWGTAQIAEAMAEIEVSYRLPEGEWGFDDRPIPHGNRSSDTPAGDSPEDLREPAQVVSGRS